MGVLCRLESLEAEALLFETRPEKQLEREPADCNSYKTHCRWKRKLVRLRCKQHKNGV